MTREVLPSRRNCWHQRAVIGGVTCHLTCGEYPDGRLGEVFITVAKAGAALRATLDSFAINFSLALQHGTPLATLVDAHRRTDFAPQGPVVAGGSPVDGQEVRSVVDWIMREIEEAYLKDRTPPRAEEEAL